MTNGHGNDQHARLTRAQTEHVGQKRPHFGTRIEPLKQLRRKGPHELQNRSEVQVCRATLQEAGVRSKTGFVGHQRKAFCLDLGAWCGQVVEAAGSLGVRIWRLSRVSDRSMQMAAQLQGMASAESVKGARGILARGLRNRKRGEHLSGWVWIRTVAKVGPRGGPIFGSVLATSLSPNSQQQNALGYNLSMQGIGTVAIDGPRFEEFWRSRKEFLRSRKGWSRKGVSQGFCCWVAQLG